MAAAVLLALAYGTTDIATINAAARAGEASPLALAAAALVAVAALLKSAQFPTHGWLTEVMEAPTPVSALLHAGVINAGGFLLIRFADLMLAAPGVLAALAMIGGFTALFGGLVMLTQPAVKTSLAWSTVAQMGFMILQCGLALFPLALLHIVAHSLYKAHAFLASGGAVEQIAAIARPGPVAVPSGAAVGQAFLVALAIYAAVGAVFGVLFGLENKSPQALALGAILDLRCRLSSGPGPGRCRAARTDAKDRNLLDGGRDRLLRASERGRMAFRRNPAGDAVARPARMDADGARRAQLRAGRRRPGALAAVVAASGSRGTARPSLERALCQRNTGPHARRLVRPQAILIC